MFAGQGAQTVGMGRDLAEKFDSVRGLFERADAQLGSARPGFSLTQKMFEGPAAELTRTSICQPALYVHGLACLEILKSHVPDLEIAGCAGLSDPDDFRIVEVDDFEGIPEYVEDYFDPEIELDKMYEQYQKDEENKK